MFSWDLEVVFEGSQWYSQGVFKGAEGFRGVSMGFKRASMGCTMVSVGCSMGSTRVHIAFGNALVVRGLQRFIKQRACDGIQRGAHGI